MVSHAFSHVLLTLILATSLFSTQAFAQANVMQQLHHRNDAGLGLLNLRQDSGTTTCPGGGLCTLGNICCGSGCMFSSSTCCGDPYFCYAGETCSAPNSVGDINCCVGNSCTPAKFVIAYASGAAGGASSTGSAVASVVKSTNSGTAQTSTAQTSVAQTSQATVVTPTSATGAASVVTSASPSSTSKAAAAQVKASVAFEVQAVILTTFFFLAM